MSTPQHASTSTSSDKVPTGVDYYEIAADLTDAEREVWATVRSFVDEKVVPVAGGYWERPRCPWSCSRSTGS